MTVPAPRAAVRTAKSLKNATGAQPTIATIDHGHWRLVLENERVRLTIDYRGKPSTAKWAGSTLSVDGRQRVLAQDFDDFVRIWKKYTPVAAQLAPVPPGGALQVMPVEVRAVYTILQQAFERRGLPGVLDAGCTRDRWVIGLTMEGRGLRITLFRGRHGEWEMRRSSVQVIVRGRDLSAEVAGDISKAMAKLVPPRREGVPGESAVAAAPAAASNPVATRKSTVMRN